ncbi:MAG: hypothetical protein WA777_11890 [Rhodanobacter sp.]
MEKQMKHYLVLAALLISALGCYIAGSAGGGIAFICLGVLLELSFWFRLFQRHRNRSQPV